MLTIARLARAIEAVLPDLDTAVLLPRKRKHVARVPLATLLAAIIWFSCSSMTTWKRFVRLMLPMHLSRYRLSYSRWSFWRAELAGMVEALAEHLCIKQAYRGVALVDSTCLPVCSIQRERDHKCFKGHASKGCGSLGWFYGFKLHLITSDTGEILRFWLSTGKTHDTAPLFQYNFLRGLEGLLIGDSGYRVKKGQARGQGRSFKLDCTPGGRAEQGRAVAPATAVPGALARRVDLLRAQGKPGAEGVPELQGPGHLQDHGLQLAHLVHAGPVPLDFLSRIGGS